jgi:hypothetical protein
MLGLEVSFQRQMTGLKRFIFCQKKDLINLQPWKMVRKIFFHIFDHMKNY